MNANFFRNIALAALTALTVSACGGGGGDTVASGGTGGTGIVSTGVMTRGSVIVNGVRFEDSTANITIDDTPKLPIDLKDGMVVKVRGRINDDRVNGTAERVEVENEVRGTVQTHNENAVPPTFTVVGQTVVVDDLTKFANFIPADPTPSVAIGQLADLTSVVEVHGLRDAVTGSIHASRVELVAPGAVDELRGIVKAPLTATAFTLQNGTTDVAVNYNGATISPVGASLAVGVLVELHGSFSAGTFTATRVDIEAAEDAQFEHAAGEELHVEGQVSGCGALSPCTSFSVGTQAVQTNSSTRFENGSAADLADGARVEVEGRNFVGTTLTAEKVQFKRTRVILTGTASVAGTITGPGTFQVLGKTVQVTSLTDFSQTADGVISDTERVEVRGYVDAAGNIIAERLDDSPSGGNKDTVQARVTNKVGNVLTFSLGINADLSGATQLLDANDQPIATLAAFLGAVTPAPAPGGTLVKVRGTFSAGTIVAEEAELEN